MAFKDLASHFDVKMEDNDFDRMSTTSSISFVPSSIHSNQNNDKRIINAQKSDQDNSKMSNSGSKGQVGKDGTKPTTINNNIVITINKGYQP